jgi:inorganic phosphate transporter, PiT family
VRWGVASEMVTAWVLTFPACLALGWAVATLFTLLGWA